MMSFEDNWNRTFAEETVVLVTNGPLPGAPTHVGILGDSGVLELTLDKAAARAIAVRLVEVASDLPDPPRVSTQGSHFKCDRPEHKQSNEGLQDLDD